MTKIIYTMDIVWMWVTPRENKGVLRSIRANCRSSSNSYCSNWVFKPWKCFVNSLPFLEKILTPHWVEMWTQVKIPTVKMPRRSSKVFRLNWAPLLSVSFNLINQDINPFLQFLLNHNIPQPQAPPQIWHSIITPPPWCPLDTPFFNGIFIMLK